jgi:hypothetical protein
MVGRIETATAEGGCATQATPRPERLNTHAGGSLSLGNALIRLK